MCDLNVLGEDKLVEEAVYPGAPAARLVGHEGLLEDVPQGDDRIEAEECDLVGTRIPAEEWVLRGSVVQPCACRHHKVAIRRFFAKHPIIMPEHGRDGALPLHGIALGD